MDNLTDLKFDEKTYDTRLAETYLKTDNNFTPFGCDKKIDKEEYNVTLGQQVCNIFYSSYNEVFDLNYVDVKLTGKPCMGRKLAKKIEENANLFSQLEYLIRNITIDEAKTHIGLIVQQLRCREIVESTEYSKTYLLMTETTPLFYLGCVALNCYYARISIVLISTTKTAAVCRLFAQLCHKCGLKIILAFVEDTVVDSVVKDRTLTTIDDLTSGCTGVITERSDLDSAVDVFLSSTKTSPWRLRRILIQESVYELFKNIVTWRSNQRQTKTEEDQQVLDEYRSYCTDVFLIDGKIFLLDFAGPAPDGTNLVMIEAYRTTKELLGLLKVYNTFYLSLWSSDGSEYNEIALQTASPVVWVNDYAMFHGPPGASQCIYSTIYWKLCTKEIGNTRNIKELQQLSDAWLKIDFEERIEIVHSALKKFVTTSEKEASKECLQFAKDLQDAILDLQSNTFTDVQNGKMCLGIRRAIGIILLKFLDEQNYCGVLRSVVRGNAFAVDAAEYSTLIMALKTAGVPVIFDNDWSGNDFKVVRDPSTLYKCKVIWTNYGTVFAN